MRNWRFESETARLFRAEDSLELVDIKNVIELSVLRPGSGAASAQEYELASNTSTRLERRDLVFAISHLHRGQRLIFYVAPHMQKLTPSPDVASRRHPLPQGAHKG